MVVRERRRIAALARTASSLDEKVQAAERTATEKESAFRVYVDEQRLEAADRATQQQEHILSLMNMVDEHPDDMQLSSPVRSAKARHAEKANAKLLILANERIAVLESQLNEATVGREEIRKQRERENEVNTKLEEKTQECENLEQELNDLRSAMSRIREQITIHDDLSVDETYDDQRQMSKSVLDIVGQSLRPRMGSDDVASKRRRRSVALLGAHGLATHNQTDDDHASDGDEVPDWADDIMKDLEIIARGEIPSALLESPDVVDAHSYAKNPNVFDRLTDPQSFTGIQKNTRQNATKKSRSGPEISAPNGQKHRKMMSRQIANSLDSVVVPGDRVAADPSFRSSKHHPASRSVFDRLLSPSNMTGTQKQRYQHTKGKRDNELVPDEHKLSEKAKVFSGHDSDLSKEAERMPSDILSDVDGETKSDAKGKVATTNPTKSKSSRKREEYQGLNVFERLNRTTTEAYAVKKNLNIAEKMLDDLLDETEAQEEVETHKVEFHTDRIDAYTRQDVFQRLQNTTTRAYAVKQSGSLTSDKTDSDVVPADVAVSIVESLDAVLSPNSQTRETVLNMDENSRMMEISFDEGSVAENSSLDHRSPVASRLRSRHKMT